MDKYIQKAPKYFTKQSVSKNNGFCIPDISKTYLYDFQYNFILKCLEKGIYSGTQILRYTFEQIYEEINKDNNLFDTSNYPPIMCCNFYYCLFIQSEKNNLSNLFKLQKYILIPYYFAKEADMFSFHHLLQKNFKKTIILFK